MTASVRSKRISAPVLLYCILLSLSPWPIFFDLSSFSIIISKDFWDVRFAVPVPIGLFTITSAFIIGKIYCLMGSRQFIQVNTSFFGITLVAVFGVVAALQKIGLGLPISRIIQTFSPIIIVMMISFPAQQLHQVLVVRSVFISVSLLISTHFISVMISSKGALRPNAIYDFSFYYEFLIYQSLVSYSGFLSLAFIFLMGYLFQDRNRSCLNKIVMRSIVHGWTISMLCMTLFLGITGARRAFILELSLAISWISLMLLIAASFRLKLAARQFTCALFLLSLWALGLGASWETNLLNRFLEGFTESGYDPGRMVTYGRGLDYLNEQWVQVLFGLGSQPNPGFHNSWIDLLYRFGMVGATVFVIFLARYLYLIHTKIKRKVDHWSPTSFTPLILICGAVQTFVNSSLFLPYYFINFVTFFLLLVVIEKRNITI